MRHNLLLVVLLSLSFFTEAQINPQNINIARDAYGLPHVMAKTDEEVAYGLAWVQCEDQFEVLQQTLLFTTERLGREYGREGATGDFFSGLYHLEELVEARKDTDISSEFMAYVEAFCQGLNTFAEAHPKEVIDKRLFPIRPETVIESYPLKITEFIGVSNIVSRIVNGDSYDKDLPSVEFSSKGSNSFAFRSHMTKDGRTYLIANPHQPFTGPEHFYEVALMSEEGWQFQGALFPGSLSPQIGTNGKLAWTHTNNYYDHTDVYALKMHPTDPLTYEYDGQWLKLEERKLKLKVKLKAIPFPITVGRKVYESVYGPTLESKSGNFFAIRTPPAMTIKTAEQWWRMSRAQNIDEFMEALKMDGLPYFNITYADKDDNIFYLFNGLFPDRKPGYDYTELLPGNTSETNWDNFLPLEERPLIMNPPCGYVYNVNHNPYKCTCKESWLDSADYKKEIDFDQADDNVRSVQWREIYQDGTPLSMEELKALKYDARLPKETGFTRLLNRFRAIEGTAQTQPIINALQEWDAVVDQNKPEATYALLCWFKLEGEGYNGIDSIPDANYAAALQATYDHLMTHFNTLEVPYKDFFRFKRGDKNLPIFGFPQTLAARWGSISEQDGRYYAEGGDGFMMFIQFDQSGVVEMESIVAYGASAEEDSPYYNAQMELFTAKKAKPQTFDREEILKQAVKVYHPE